MEKSDLTKDVNIPAILLSRGPERSAGLSGDQEILLRRMRQLMRIDRSGEQNDGCGVGHQLIVNSIAVDEFPLETSWTMSELE